MARGLARPAFRQLALTNIQPMGWLLDQLRVQASGLSGNLDLVWRDIRESRWMGGPCDGWERVPYWLDGFIPLAWLLGDEELQARATAHVDRILANQAGDGWICPCSDSERAGYDLWAAFLVLKALVGYHRATGDERIEGAVRRALLAIDRHIDGKTLFDWAQMRWSECLVSMWWLYDRTGEDWLLSLAAKLRAQGFDWARLYEEWPYAEALEPERWSHMSHVVNNAMALKQGALTWRMTRDRRDLDAAEAMHTMLRDHHGMVTGTFTGDECLAGLDPTRGTELCAVVECMYSFEELLAISGDPKWGDRLELVAYNALPATFSPDMWTHQYDQQVNQVDCSAQADSPFGTNGGEAHTFGLEPNYGCCTANLSQGWPKLAASAILASDDGLCIALYAPCRATHSVRGQDIEVEVATQYPFRDTVAITVRVDAPTDFVLQLRIPEWSQTTRLTVDGEADAVPARGTFHALHRVWPAGETRVTLTFDARLELVPRPIGPEACVGKAPPARVGTISSGSVLAAPLDVAPRLTKAEYPQGLLVALKRGTLVYALPLGECWTQRSTDRPEREFPHCDYDLRATTPWNYGLRLSAGALQDQVVLEEREFGPLPFSPQGAPLALKARGSLVEWGTHCGGASAMAGMAWVCPEAVDLTLIPYGCTNLRMTEMPLLRPEAAPPEGGR